MVRSGKCNEKKVYEFLKTVPEGKVTTYGQIAVYLGKKNWANRLSHKASKQHIASSRERVIAMDRQYRLESNPGEIPFENYMRIDNSQLEPDVVAAMIKERFRL